ncbi:YggT family protein [Candidatus Saccharibacteria bacterium]|nr:YggT family protein [Candidatus Saccharibacteria bacterium]
MPTKVPEKPVTASDTKLMFLKFSRVLTYIVYGYSLVASAFLALGFILLLFSASTSAAFTQFIYRVAAAFLEPFRGIFPAHPVSETGYFSASALFAIMVYLFVALMLHALITYVTSKQVKHQQELDTLLAAQEANKTATY